MERVVAREDAHLVFRLPFVQADEALLACIFSNLARSNKRRDLGGAHLAQATARYIRGRCSRRLGAHRCHRAKQLHHEHEVAAGIPGVRGQQRVLVVVAAAAHKQNKARRRLRLRSTRSSSLSVARLGRSAALWGGNVALLGGRVSPWDATLRRVLVVAHEALAGTQ